MTRSLNRPLLLILLLYGPLLTNSWWFFDNEDSLSKKVEELTQEEVTGTPIEESDDSDDYSTSRRLKFGIKEHRFNSSLVVDEDNEVDDEEGNVEHNDEEVPKLDPVPENIYTTTENVPELPTPLPDNGEESPEEPESTTEALVIPADISDTDLSADDKQHATESAEAEVTTTVIPTSTVEVTEVPAHPEATEPTTESSVEATEPTTKSHSDVTDSDVTVVDIESHEGDLIPKEDATTVKTETDFQNEADVTEKQIEDSTTTLPEFRATPEVEGDQEQSQEGQEAEQFQATTTSLDQIEETEATESPEAPEVTETTHDKRTTGSALEEDTSTVEPQQTTLTLADQPLLETTTMAPIVQPANEESERTDEVAESTTIYPEATKSARDENNINVGNEEERNEYTTIDPVGRANEGEGFETTPEDVAFSPPTADSNDILQNIEIDTPDKENQVVYITNIDDLPTSTVLRGRRPPAEVTPPTNQVQERQETEAPQRPYKPNSSRLTRHCADGSTPEFSLHGSTYCWSDAVCPTGFACVDAQCCHSSGQNQKRSVKHHCDEDEFRCKNGQCIDSNLECNRRYDCPDGSDELHCDYFNRVQQRPTTPPHVLEQQRREQEAERRRIHEEHLRRVEEARRERERLDAIQSNQVKSAEISFDEGCSDDEFTCSNGKCIDKRRKCNQIHDCSDGSDEEDCENSNAGSEDLQITVYPHELSVREGREARFECRARTSDGSTFPQTRWTKVGGPLPKHAHESGAELFIPSTNVNDRGRYACIAVLNGRSVEAYATLDVQSYGPQTFSNALPAGPSHGCMADERACGSNECVKSDYVCDGERDCRDGSDEENCPAKRHCEPNEFRCNNDRCVQKMWLCDGDDDCGDRSDEQNCKERKPGELCQPTEFQCADKRQCVPRSFQCDGTNDCRDGSDEVGCVQPTVVQPPDSNRIVRQGDQFKLTCRAVAVPDPYINWRLNWGPVCEPPRCQQHSEGGVGTLTVNNAQPMDQGAYTCEAINVKGRVLATPDCIVRIVNIPAPPPPTAPPAQSCRSGEYNSPQQSKGCLNCFCFGVSNQCQSSNWYRTKEKLYFAEGHSDGVVLTDIEKRPVSEQFEYTVPEHLTNTESHPEIRYWQLPQRFLGDKVSAYGGDLSIQLQYAGSGPISPEPLIVLKGNGITLVHRPRDQERTFQPHQPVRVQFETYENNFEHLSGQPAQRSDLMMVLADLDTFLIRATHTDDQTSTSLGDVNWQIAVERDTQEGYALEVEQCSCPPGYTGLSCEDCAPGYERSGQGPYLGTCIPIRERPRPQISCGPGAVAPTTQDRCECKPNVVGLNCDRCAPNTFGLSAHNPQGCNRCWCAGVTGTCDSSSFRRAQVEVDYQRGAQDQLQVQTNDIESPFQPSQQPRVTGSSISFDGFSEARGQPLYWKLPAKFAGDKVTSYGGNLEYSGRCSGSGEPTPDAAVIIRGNNVVLHHQSRQPQTAEQEHRVSIPITEQSFTRADGQPASREDLLMALADVDDVLVKSTCVQDTTNSELYSVKLDYAEPYGSGANAVEVEQCQCPIGYVGPSCEDCAPGYSRVQGGPYLGLCQKCDCNGHASQCDSQYGTCLNCQHNTEGDHCERCAPGFVGDARRGTPHDCQPEQVKPPCQCHNHSPRGCDSFGRCLLCEHNTEGFHCEACKKGFYGDATRGSPYDCTPCPCPGAADCFLDNGGQVQCRNCPAGYAGRLCDECAPGYTRSQQSGGRECEPIGRVEPDRVHFVDNPAVPLRVEILAPKHLVIHEGQRAKWTCQVVGHKPENVDVSWIKVGEGELPPHVRVHNTNQIVIDQVRHSDQGQYRCIGTSKIDGTQASDDATLQISRPPQLPASPSTGPVPQPVVTPPQQTVNQHQSATFTCLVPGFADCEVVWHFNEINGALPPGVHRRGNQIFIPQAEQHHVGNYICTVANQYGQGVSNPGHLDVNKPDMRPIADPPVQTVSVNDPARFRCWVPGHPDAKITWRPEQGSSLPQDVEQRDGILNIPHAQQHHAQRYICSASDPSAPNRPPVDANPVQLVIKAPDAPVAPQVDPLHQQVPKGSPARFRCWVPGKPDAQVKWSVHGGGALPEGAVDKDGVLEFPSVDDFHAGGYVCSVFNPENGQPIDSPVARLDVKQPLNPQVDPREQTVPEGNPAKIRCWVDGVPNALLRWNVKGGRPLPAGARDDGRGNLYIDRVGQEHATDYECTAYDPVDRTPAVSEPANIQVQRAEQPQVSAQGRPPRPVATPPVITVKRGDPARFHCDPNSDVPAEVHWGYGSANGPLEGDVSQNGDDVIINSADDSNAGEYYCQATNEFGTGQAEPVKLVIVDDEEVIPPTARVEPKVWNGEPGETHQFKCIVTGTPHPTIKWVGPDGSSLPEGVVDLGEGILEISKAKKSLHDGDYTCTASNEHGEASDKGTANINPSIKIIIDKPETGTPLGPRIVLTVGEPLEIRCTAHGEPDPDVEWLHDPGPERGDLPDDYVPITISEQFIRHPAIGLGNAGRYTCKGSNQFSTVTKDIYVEVVEATARTTVAIIGGSNQFFPTNQPAQILCTATGASLVDRIEWTRLDGGLPDGVEAHNEPGLLHFEQFRESDAGEYECRAYRKEELIASSTVHVYADNRTPADVAHVEISAPSVRVVNKGDSIVLDCLVHGGHDSELKYRWSLARGGSVVKQLGEEAQLTIKSADPTNDYGIYRCEVDNDDGDTLGSAQAAVSVGYDASTNPEEAKFEEESEAVLICPVFTVPGATVTWYKHSGELPKEAEQNGNKLTIPLFTEETAGLYTCTVQYGQSTVEGYINAKIFVPDTTIQVVLNVSSESVREGDRVWLDCVVTGDPTAKIEFSKVDADELPSGAQITECDDLAREKKVTGNRLLFTSVTADDAGKYQCRAYITGGFLDTSALLSVEPAKPEDVKWVKPPEREDYDEFTTTSYVEHIIDVTTTLPPQNMPHTTPYSQELYTTQRPEVLASTSYSKIPYTTPYTTLYSLSPSESTQVIVGETAFLPCRAYGVSSIDSRIYWEKLDGAMPSQFRIGDTALVIPKVKKQDAGTYRCIVDTVDGQNHVAIAELSVGDYIPTFDGSRIIEITPLTHEQWQRLDLEISLRPNKENGVVYHAERHAPAQDHQLFHDIALKRGHVVYTFDVGNGVSRVQSPVSIKNGEWSKIRIRNDESRVSLNVNHQTSGHARNAPLPYIKEINDGTVYLGGIPGHSKQYQQLKQPENFAGSISKLVINGKSIDIGESATSPPEVVLQLSTNECFDSPCQNAAQCVPAHEFEGFKCECEAEFTGEYCQFRTGLCSNKEMCEHGVCVDGDWGENHCVCPYGRYGKYCENMKTDIPIITYDEMGRANKGSKFNGRTSFISVPAPQSSRHFRLSLDINPKNSQKPQLLAYVASTYNTKKAEYMALVLQDEALYGLYHGKHGTNQLRSYGRVNANKTHDVSFLHSGKTIELIVDGRRTMQHLEEPAFSTGTALYIGGLAPGMMVTEELEQYGNYEGCLSTIRVNRQLIEVESTRDVESGDLGECMLNVDEVYVTASPSEVRPIYIPPARGEQEYYTPGEHLPLQSRNKDVTVPPDDGLESVSITEFTGSEDHFTPRMTVLPTTTTTTQRPTTTSTLPPTTTLTTTTTELTTTTEASTTTSYWYYSTTVATTRRKNLYRVTSTRKPTTTVRPYTTVDYYITKGLEYDTTTVYLTSTTTYPTTSTTTITRRPYTTSTVTMKPTEQYVHVASEDDTVATLRPTDKVLPSTTVHTITKDSMLDTTRIIRPTKPPNVELDNRPVDNTKTEPISTIQTQPLSTAKSEEARDLEVDETSEELTIEDPDELPDTATTISPLVTKVVDLPTDVPPHDSYVSDIDSEELKETKITPTMTSDDDLKAKSSLHTTEIVYEEDSLETTEIVRPTESLDEVRLGLCEDADCGEHGVCEPVNQTHVACACRDYYVGPNCDQFKPIEYAAKFEGNAWIMFSVDDFPHLTSEKREIVEFRFKTTAEYGVMLWQGQTTETSVIGEDYVSIGLNDGFLVFSYELGGGAAQIISETPVNDGKEHYVRVERRGRNGTLVVDNQEPVEGRSSGILAMLNVEGNIYVGGLPDLTTMTAGLHSHNFVGCIADLRLNEDPLDLMGNAIDGKNVRPCDGWTRKRKWLQQKYRHRRFRTHG